MTDKRQSGRTTAQIQAAPRGAYYIVPNLNVWNHCRKLSFQLERSDLTMFTTDAFFSRNVWRGVRLQVVIHHACDLTEYQRAILREIQSRVQS